MDSIEPSNRTRVYQPDQTAKSVPKANRLPQSPRTHWQSFCFRHSKRAEFAERITIVLNIMLLTNFFPQQDRSSVLNISIFFLILLDYDGL